MILLSDITGQRLIFKIIFLVIAIIVAILRASYKKDQKTSSYKSLSNSELSDAKKMYAICKNCGFKKMDLKTGIQCELTNSKPNFTGNCPDFVQKD